MERKEGEYPLTAGQGAITNAVCHRDFPYPLPFSGIAHPPKLF
jgi:predicted HTH transcriptional regulator